MITRTKEHCEDIMREILYKYEDTRESIVITQASIKEGVSMDTWITLSVGIVLFDYAYRLFNTFPADQDLYEPMERLVKEVNRWCNGNRVNKWIKEQRDITRPTHKNKSLEEKAGKLHNHITAVFNLIGEKYIPEEVKAYLDDVSENAEEYVSSITYHVEVSDEKTCQTEHIGLMSTARNKEPIENYLNSLNLKDKSKVIPLFISALNC